ncbi:DWNN-domain-containing protein [Artomyces pyxidatus]|uniref:DWNN-domain-containing protein n=1 Tax=Artomyces pyxidatus TaxID=48021 RepID=A0ACB8SMK5_9AGAM|nr:DWNN-domain-containing protein [Artomyces pyxidatus]
MASSVFYKFKSQRDESRVTFDGTGISVFDLKKEIILANNLGKANDFDLAVLDSSSGEEFKDDSRIIPRSSSVIVKRVPPARPGKGKAAMYIAAQGAPAATPEPSKPSASGSATSTWSNKGGMSKRFVKEENPRPSSGQAKPAVSKEDEAAAMAAMFQAQTENWEETQEKMSHATRIYTNPRGTGFSRGGAKPFTPHQSHHPHSDRPLPPSYVCYRCGQKGHWIQDCPTNSDREFDNKPRIKRTTGIPRSFLKAVDNPAPGGAQIPAGVMVTPEGGYVVAQPDVASWQKQVAKPKGLSETEIRERPSKDPSIVCPIDNQIFRDAVKTPCCGTPYCEECIQTHLLEKDFICPKCGTKVASLDKLVVDKPTRTKVMDYIEKEMEASKKEEERILNGEAPSASASQVRLPPPATAPSLTERPAPQTPAPEQPTSPEQEAEFYAAQQLSGDLAMSQMIVDNIPQLQAQIQQISQMLQSATLPAAVRQQTEMQHQQLQMQLGHAQTIGAALAAAQALQQVQSMPGPGPGMGMGMNMGMNMNMNMGMNMGMMGQGFGGGSGVQQQFQQQQAAQGQPVGGWNNFQNQQQAGQDSAYQRLPLNNRRRNMKRDRPSDFLEIAGPDAEREAKMARYWE